jgi:STE24 endopeptidase
MHPLLVAFIIASCGWSAVTLYLNHRQAACVAANRNIVPADFAGQVSLADHRKAADYTRARLALGSLHGVVSLAVNVALVAWGLDVLAGLAGHIAEPWGGVLLVVTAAVPGFIVDLPFEAYADFVVEARFEFNKKTPAIFVTDMLKGLAIKAVIGLPLLLSLFWAMDHLTTYWWFYAWIILTCIMLAAPFVYLRFIAPMFNTFTPLADGPMRARIEGLMARCGFRSSGLFTMDASRRSSHGNAYFIGFGRAKRIVLFDTLLSSQTEDEIDAVLAHELGHFKYRHTLFGMVRGAGIAFLMLAAYGWMCQRPWLLEGFGFRHGGNALGLIAASLVLGIVTPALGPVSNWISRRQEFQADDFARRMVGADPMVSALTKLARDNAGTLTPDPLYAVVNYGHPPVPVRVAHLRATAA